MDNIFWQIKGYSGINLTEEKLLQKKYSFKEIEKEDKEVLKNIEESLKKGGIVFCLHKKDIIKVVYIFKLTTKSKQKTLVFDSKIVLEEASRCIKAFERDIHTVLNSIMINRHDIDKAIWQDKEITREKRFNSNIKAVKTIIWVAIMFCCIACLVIAAISTAHALDGITSESIEKMISNNNLVNYVSMINNFDYIETLDTIAIVSNKIGFVFIYIILPSIGTLAGYILMIIALIYMLELIKDVSDNKSLFTKGKYLILRRAIIIAYIAGLFLIGDLLIWLALSIVVEIILYIFSYCVYLTNKSK